MAILGHGSNTVDANYGSGYALDVMRENMETVWVSNAYVEAKLQTKKDSRVSVYPIERLDLNLWVRQ